MSFIRKQFSALRDYHRGDFRHQVFITAAAFFIIVGIGVAVGVAIPDLVNNVFIWFTKVVSEAGVVDDDGTLHAIPLFFKNFEALLVGIFYGFIPFLYLPALNLGVNGLLVGLLGGLYVGDTHGLLLYLGGILPHGIFEIPAMILAFSCGLYLCRTITDYVRHNESCIVRRCLVGILRIFVIEIIPLLITAALMECFVTPKVIELLL